MEEDLRFNSHSTHLLQKKKLVMGGKRRSSREKKKKKKEEGNRGRDGQKGASGWDGMGKKKLWGLLLSA